MIDEDKSKKIIRRYSFYRFPQENRCGNQRYFDILIIEKKIGFWQY